MNQTPLLRYSEEADVCENELSGSWEYLKPKRLILK
jgi:hypothetical protein